MNIANIIIYYRNISISYSFLLDNGCEAMEGAPVNLIAVKAICLQASLGKRELFHKTNRKRGGKERGGREGREEGAT